MVPLILESCAKSFKTPDLLKLLQREKRALKKKLLPGGGPWVQRSVLLDS